MRGVVVIGCCCAVLAAPLSTSASPGVNSWARTEIVFDTSHGLFPGSASSFRPADPLTAGTLATAVAGLTGQPLQVPADSEAPVSIAQLDASLVGVLGLSADAHRFQVQARSAGLQPPTRFGTEVIARLIGLRYDHPPSADRLELEPQQTATRAEAAFSVARTKVLLSPPASPKQFFGADPNGAIALVDSWAQGFSLPPLDAQQLPVLQTAVSLIGYPYVWGGTDENVSHGFDCSGLVWRVFKLASYPADPGLAAMIQGRTAAQMAGEVPKRERISFRNLEPGDVLFFGNGPKSKAADIGHTAIYLGNDWMIQSSGQGVSLAPVVGYYRSAFAWARRPLAEAGLAAGAGSVGAAT
jgi:cell wall-associated NlpC family hydrolase